MRFTIIYRDRLEENRFMNALMCICSTKGDVLVLGYGYSNYNIFEDKSLAERFRTSINNGFKEIENPQIIVIGCKGTQRIEYINEAKNVENKEKYDLEENKYKNFISKLKEVINNDEVKITGYLSNKHNFHNKIAFKTDNKVIKALMTGSSNLTKNTLYIKGHKFFNKENDILFWDEHELKEEKDILDEITKKIICNNDINKYEDYFIKDLNIDIKTIKGINLNSHIISPIEVYNLKDRLSNDVFKSGNYKSFNFNKNK